MRTITWQVGSGSPTTINISDTATATEVRVAIQTALDDAGDAAASAGQQATVTLSAGEFAINGDGTASHGGVHIDSNVTLQGTTSGGANQTTIKLDDAYTSADVTGIVRTESAAGVHDVVIKNINIEGNGQLSDAGQDVDGIYTGFDPNSTHDPGEAHYNITIDNVEVSQVSRYGIDPHEQTSNLTIRNSVSHDNGKDGFVLDYIEGGVLENNVAYGNGRHGFNLVTGTHDIVMTGNIAHDNGVFEAGNGIVIQPPSAANDPRVLWSYNITITGGSTYSNDQAGIRIANGEHITIEGVDIHDNGENGVRITNQVRSGSDPVLPEATGITITGNLIVNNGALSDDGTEIRLDDDINDITVIANRVGATGTIDYHFGASLGTLTIDGNRYERGNVTFNGVTTTIPDDPAVVGAISLASLSNAANNASYGSGRQYVEGNGGNDTIATGTGNDAIVGGDGNDTASGGDGDDALWGDSGNDTLDGGIGADKMQGGVGDDTFIVDNAGDIVLEGFDSGSDLIQSSVTFSINANADLENLTLTGSAAINGTGNTVANVMYGNTGSNTLSAGGGDDSVYGDNGHDTLNGSTGLDTLLGQNGADVLYGGASKDTLTGGNSNDTYKYVTTAESSVAGTGRDLITDFGIVSGNDDIIDLSGIDANIGVSGNQAFTWVGNGSFTAAGQIRYAVVGGNTFVYGSVDADTAAEFAIEITGTPTLTAADFIL